MEVGVRDHAPFNDRTEALATIHGLLCTNPTKSKKYFVKAEHEGEMPFLPEIKHFIQR